MEGSIVVWSFLRNSIPSPPYAEADNAFALPPCWDRTRVRFIPPTPSNPSPYAFSLPAPVDFLRDCVKGGKGFYPPRGWPSSCRGCENELLAVLWLSLLQPPQQKGSGEKPSPSLSAFLLCVCVCLEGGEEMKLPLGSSFAAASPMPSPSVSLSHR